MLNFIVIVYSIPEGNSKNKEQNKVTKKFVFNDKSLGLAIHTDY